MEIILEGVGRKFNGQWIFKNISLILSISKSYIVTGPNGSGKSTFLAIASGFLTPSAGAVYYQANIKKIDQENFFTYISFVAPYLELIEEFSLSELIDFHFKFTKFIKGETKKTLLEFINLNGSVNKELKYFSSGMKQRAKLGLALFSDKPILFLDEPTVNLDIQGAKWYRENIENFIKNRITIVASNDQTEYAFSENVFNITDFKGAL